MALNFNNDNVNKNFDEFSQGLDDVSSDRITVMLKIASETPEDAKDEI